MENKTYAAVRRKVNGRDQLFYVLKRGKLKLVGYVKRSESLEANLLTGMVIGNRERVKPKAQAE